MAGLAVILAACGARGGRALTPSSAGDVSGVVDAGPTCPVQRPGQSCPPRPLVATVSARDNAGRVEATARTDATGAYHLTVAPGTYALVVELGSPFPVCQPVGVTVTPGASTRADIHCDTGIR